MRGRGNGEKVETPKSRNDVGRRHGRRGASALEWDRSCGSRGMKPAARMIVSLPLDALIRATHEGWRYDLCSLTPARWGRFGPGGQVYTEQIGTGGRAASGTHATRTNLPAVT